MARYAPLARNLAAGLSRAPQEADDLVQEAMTGLIRAVRGDPERFEGEVHARNYFLRAVRNLALKRRERGRERRSLGDEDELLASPAAESAGVSAEHEERIGRLRRLLRTLAREERALLVRRYLRRETLASIAADTGVPVSTLHSREKALLARLAAAALQEERSR